MIIGISSGHFDYASFPEAFTKVASWDLDLLEFSDHPRVPAQRKPETPAQRQEIKRLAQSSDIGVSYHPKADFAGLPRSQARLLLLDFLRQSRQMGASYLILTLGRTPDETVGLARMIDLFRWASGLPEARGIKICVENLHSEKRRELGCKLQHLRDFFAGVRSSKVGLNLDFGHGNMAIGNDVLLKEFGERVFYTHFHDNFGKVDQHLPVGYGNIYWRAIYEKLVALKFEGPYVIEFSVRYGIEEFLKELRLHMSESSRKIICNRHGDSL